MTDMTIVEKNKGRDFIIIGIFGLLADRIPMIRKGVASPIVTIIVMFTIDWRIALVAIGVRYL